MKPKSCLPSLASGTRWLGCIGGAIVSGGLGGIAGCWYVSDHSLGALWLIGGMAGLVAGALVGWFWAWRVNRGLAQYLKASDASLRPVRDPAIRWGVWGGLAASLAVHGVLIATVHLMSMSFTTYAIWPIVAILGQLTGLLGGAMVGQVFGGVVCSNVHSIHLRRMRQADR